MTSRMAQHLIIFNERNQGGNQPAPLPYHRREEEVEGLAVKFVLYNSEDQICLNLEATASAILLPGPRLPVPARAPADSPSTKPFTLSPLKGNG